MSHDRGIVPDPKMVAFLDFAHFPPHSWDLDFDVDVCRKKVALLLKVHGFDVTTLKQLLQMEDLTQRPEWRTVLTAITQGIVSCTRPYKLTLDHRVPESELEIQYTRLIIYGKRAMMAKRILECGAELNSILPLEGLPVEKKCSKYVREYIKKCIHDKRCDLIELPMQSMTVEQFGKWLRDKYSTFTPAMEARFHECEIDGDFYMDYTAIVRGKDNKITRDYDLGTIEKGLVSDFGEVFNELPMATEMAKLLATDRKFWYRLDILFRYALLFLNDDKASLHPEAAIAGQDLLSLIYPMRGLSENIKTLFAEQREFAQRRAGTADIDDLNDDEKTLVAEHMGLGSLDAPLQNILWDPDPDKRLNALCSHMKQSLNHTDDVAGLRVEHMHTVPGDLVSTELHNVYTADEIQTRIENTVLNKDPKQFACNLAKLYGAYVVGQCSRKNQSTREQNFRYDVGSVQAAVRMLRTSNLAASISTHFADPKKKQYVALIDLKGAAHASATYNCKQTKDTFNITWKVGYDNIKIAIPTTANTKNITCVKTFTNALDQIGLYTRTHRFHPKTEQETSPKYGMRIHVLLHAKTFTLHVKATDSIKDVKTKIEKQQGIPVDEQQLEFYSAMLDNRQTLQDYNIVFGSKLLLTLKPDWYRVAPAFLHNFDVLLASIASANVVVTAEPTAEGTPDRLMTSHIVSLLMQSGYPFKTKKRTEHSEEYVTFRASFADLCL